MSKKEIIKPHYVDLPTAQWLKEKGFNVECEYFYEKSEESTKFYLTTGAEYDSEKNCIWDWNLNGGQSGYLAKIIPYPNDSSKIYYSAPEQHVVIHWLRINYNIYVAIFPELNNGTNITYYPSIFEEGIGEDIEKYFDTPQEAYQAAFDHIRLNNLI